MTEPLISGHFFTIPCKNPLQTFALTHFSIVNFAIESEFDVNWTLGMLKDTSNCVFCQEKVIKPSEICQNP